MFCCTWAVGCRKFVQYIRMVCSGRFILVESVHFWCGMESNLLHTASKVYTNRWTKLYSTFSFEFENLRPIWIMYYRAESLYILYSISTWVSNACPPMHCGSQGKIVYSFVYVQQGMVLIQCMLSAIVNLIELITIYVAK